MSTGDFFEERDSEMNPAVDAKERHRSSTGSRAKKVVLAMVPSVEPRFIRNFQNCSRAFVPCAAKLSSGEPGLFAIFEDVAGHSSLVQQGFRAVSRVYSHVPKM